MPFCLDFEDDLKNPGQSLVLKCLLTQWSQVEKRKYAKYVEFFENYPSVLHSTLEVDWWVVASEFGLLMGRVQLSDEYLATFVSSLYHLSSHFACKIV